MADMKFWTRSIVSTAGAAMAGPAGAIIGAFLGSIIASVLPGSHDFTNQVFANLSRMSIDTMRQRLEKQLSPSERQRVNHDLQIALRDALKEALYDLGGSECFPNLANAAARDVPPQAVFGLTAPGRTLFQRKNPLTVQIQDCFRALVQAIDSQVIFPLNPPESKSSASVLSYIEAGTPKILSDQFFSENIRPVLAHFPTLLHEVPELEPHLNQFLYDRLILRLGENLKQRTPAWRAFNRLVLDTMQTELSQVVTGQSEILERLKALNTPGSDDELNSWADQMAELVAATGAISHQMDESFDELTDRVVAQHREVILRLDELVASSARIEKKVDRVLRVLSESRSVIEGEQLTIPMPKPPAPGEAPYKGLQYFTEGDASLFFGRERWIARLVNRLQATRFLAVIGASGSGKSSIVRAGVVPVLKGSKDVREVEYRPANCASWPVHIITPSSHPLESVAAVFTPNGQLDQFRSLVAQFRQDSHALDLLIRQQAATAASEHVLLVVDQFEEVFTQCTDTTERTAFLDILMTAANPDEAGTLVLMVILRADFYASCAEHEQLRLALSQYQEYIGPMTPAELRCAIEEPALRSGWKFEPGLVDLIVKDAGDEPGALPLLSHALLETWRNRSSHTMTLESYAESGGVQGAIAKTAEMVFNQRLTAQQQEVARAIFLRLTNVGEGAQETRRRSTLNELITNASQSASVEKVVHMLADARLLTVEAGSVDVAHEALIREWPKLRGWIEDNRSILRIHHRLAASAQEWQQFKQDEGLLYRGLRLQEAREIAETTPDALNELERTFLQSSLTLEQRLEDERLSQQRKELEAAQKLAAAEKQRAEDQANAARQLRRREQFLRMALIGAGLLAVLAIVFGILASISSQQANTNASLAQIASTKAVAESLTRATAETNALNQSRLSQVREVAARARSLVDRDQDLALLLGAEGIKLAQAYSIPSFPEAQTSLYQALTAANYSTTLRGHTDALNTASFSPDGQKIITASLDGTAMLWGIDGRRLAVFSGHKGSVTGASFSPDGTRILTFSADQTARLYQADGQLIQTLDGHSGEITQALFSKDGRHILTASKDGTARIWDENGKNPVILKGHSDAVLACALSPDNTLVATAGADHSVRLWKIDGSPLKVLSGHDSWVVSVQFSPDSKKLVTASWDDTAKVWSSDGSLLATLEGHQSTLSYAAFSPDGSTIVTAGSDNLAKVWSAEGKWQVDLKGHTQEVNQAVFSPDGFLIATSSLDGTVRLWQLDGSQLAVLRGHSGFVYSVSFSPDGKQLVTAGGDLTARLWQTDHLAQVFADHFGAATTGSFSPNGKFFITGSTDGYIRLHRIDGVEVYYFYTNGPINRAVVSPDGSHILVATVKPNAMIYSLKGDQFVQLTGHTGEILDARYSPDGSKVITASKDGTAKLWDTNGSMIATLRGHNGSVSSARFSPDGKTIITTGDDKTARLWKSDGTPLNIDLTHPGAVMSASFSPDGARILTGCFDGNAYLWKTDGSQIATIQGHTAPVTSGEFSPNGKLIITASYDATARLWDSNGQFITTLEGHTSILNSADFNPDGSRILTTSWDGTAIIQTGYANIGDMITEANHRVARPLTVFECKTYLYVDRCP
jgi:WD40 repeat protein